jgi:hypothetical protein
VTSLRLYFGTKEPSNKYHLLYGDRNLSGHLRAGGAGAPPPTAPLRFCPSSLHL